MTLIYICDEREDNVFSAAKENGSHRLKAPCGCMRLVRPGAPANHRRSRPLPGNERGLCAEAGWYRGRNVFRPCFFGGRRAYFFALTRRNNYGRILNMKELMQKLRESAMEAIGSADDVDALEALRVKYLGKKGELTAILKQMGKLSEQERPVMGQLANQLRSELEESLESRRGSLAEKMLDMKLKAETVDVTIPGAAVAIGHKHPMYNVLDQIKDIFIGMGFEILDGPEIELSEYNFSKLNTPDNHPAREWSDTFYLTQDSSICLRTQTSNMQVRAMESRPLPIRMLAPGRVYRKDEVDATHSPMFHQIEGMVIDKGITMGDLKATLNLVVQQIYGEGTVTRFRPHHFPFTEPSCEMDIQCHKCGGKGCPTCKGEGWIEILGAGMVHPKVLKNCGIDPDVYSGWAFGMGLERLALGEYKINDLRLIFENDVRLLEQF